ncbi:MAG TPA: hypothetical protein PLP16_12005 [Smithellaceae bacterium]|nr:hypothetical protein [Smithellaceae bacterium]
MEQTKTTCNKSIQKRIASNQSVSDVIWNSNLFIKKRSDRIFVLGIRSYLLEKAINEYQAAPQNEDVINTIRKIIIPELQATDTQDVDRDFTKWFRKYFKDENEFGAELRIFLYKSKISERKTLGDISLWCVIISIMYELFYEDCSKNAGKVSIDLAMNALNLLDDRISRKAHETVGYWTAKLDEMRRNHENIKVRTDKKEKRKVQLRQWMKTMKPKALRIKAQDEFDVSERTVLNWLKEIRDEETAILRNKDVIA